VHPKKWQKGQINSKHVATCSLKLPSLRFVHPLFSTRVSELLVYFRTIFQRKFQIFTQFVSTSFTVFHPGLSRIVQICLDIFLGVPSFPHHFLPPKKIKWLVVWNMLDLFPYIGNVIIPTEGLKPPTRFHIPSFPTYSHRYSHRYSHSYSHRYSHRYSHSYPYMFQMFPKKNEEIATARPFSVAAMAATPSLASRAAFAELLDDHWRIFRDQLLEARKWPG